MKFITMSIPIIFAFAACNPFAPGLDDTPDSGSTFRNVQQTVDGVFQNLKYAYTLRDTSVYGQLFDGNYTFLYRDYDHNNTPVTWNRNEELQTAYGLFQNVQRLDLVWNNIIDSSSVDSYTTNASISRSFNLTVTFNPSDIVRVDGYATLQLKRQRAQEPWMILSWDDQSNF